MGRRKKQDLSILDDSSIAMIEEEFAKSLQTNMEYSLLVDPLNQYNMTEEEKSFVKWYIQYRNIEIAAKIAGIPEESIMTVYSKISVQKEIVRINDALYQRRFHTKLLSMDNLESFLTSLLVDANVPIADRLSSSEKLRVIQMIEDIKIKKTELVANPTMLNKYDLETEIKDLSVDTIKSLLESNANITKKNNLIEQIEKISKRKLGGNELVYLKTLSVDELLNMLEETKKYMIENKEN